jgi:hypothetical protein
MKQPLSPTAEAVLDAYNAAPPDRSIHELPPDCGRRALAAALRAVADQVIVKIPPPCDDFDEYAQGFLAAHVKYRSQIRAIAAELEGTSPRPA